MLMLEDQSEERACLHALGLLGDAESLVFREEAAANPALLRVAADLEETLANLSLSTTAVQLPSAEFRARLFERIEAEPARVTTDRHGLLETINPAFTRLCGYRIEELRGHKPGHLLQGPETTPDSIEVLRRAVKSGSPCEVTMVNYHKNGAPYRVHIAITPVRDAAGALVGFSAVEREITGA